MTISIARGAGVVLGLLLLLPGFRSQAAVLSGSETHTCLITPAGQLQCWGANAAGQLGDGTQIDRFAPVVASQITEPVSAVSTGNGSTCVLTAAGAVKCWGENENGQLGNNNAPIDSLIPVNVVGLGGGVQNIGSGRFYTCALTAANGIKCWGGGFRGQLGTGSTADSPIPVDVTGLTSGVAELAVGRRLNCALTTGSGAKCWGANFVGQLGIGNFVQQNLPQDVTGLTSGVKRVVAGDGHACAVLLTGAVKCWGWNLFGELGNNSTTLSTVPVNVTGLASGVKDLTMGSANRTCALTDAGGVKCWGLNSAGGVGDTTTTVRLVPVDVAGLTSGVEALSSGPGGHCALRGGGSVSCWGEFNTLGNGNLPYRTTPVAVPNLGPGIQAVSSGGSRTCVLIAGGAKCVGFNEVGAVGDGTQLLRLSYVDVVGLTSGVQSISNGGDHVCAVTNAGGAKCWGWNINGGLGNNSTLDSAVPVDVNGLTSGVAQVSVGALFACAVTTTGGAKCWGANFNGYLGDSTTTQRLVPVDVTGLTNGVQAVSAGSFHACALTTGGGVKCWGLNDHGQLGDGTQTLKLAPVDVTGLASGVTAITAGAEHTCALMLGGGVKCWGRNTFGSVGNGTTTGNQLVPGDVVGLTSGVAALATSRNYSNCVLTSTGGVKCWGSSDSGDLGNGSTVPSGVPVDVTGLTSGVTMVSGSESHYCAILGGGASMRCWGGIGFGQLGTGDIAFVTAPTNAIVIGSGGGGGGGASSQSTLAGPGDLNDEAGTSVATSDSTFVIGAPNAGGSGGAVYVFERGEDGNVTVADSAKGLLAYAPDWAKGTDPVAVLTTSGGTIGDKFGTSVAISPDSDTIVVGAPLSDTTGEVFLYRRPGTEWETTASSTEIVPDASSIGFKGYGTSVAIDDSGAIAVGAPTSTTGGIVDAGAAVIFQDNGTLTTQTAQLAPPPAAGDAGYGTSVSLADGVWVVGAPNEDSGGQADAGAAYVYTTSGTTTTRLTLTTTTIGDKFGTSVATLDGIVVVGAPGQDTSAGTDSGAATVYGDSGGGYTAISTLLPLDGAGQASGTAVATNGDVIIVGAPLGSITGSPAQGRVYLYEVPEAGFVSATTRPTATLGSAASGEDDQFGTAVAASPRSLLIGVPFDDIDTTGLMQSDQGSAERYVFDRIHRGEFE